MSVRDVGRGHFDKSVVVLVVARHGSYMYGARDHRGYERGSLSGNSSWIECPRLLRVLHALHCRRRSSGLELPQTCGKLSSSR